MIYPGDIHVFTLPLDGQTVSSAPVIAVVNLITGEAVISPPAAMTLVPGSSVYKFLWSTAGLSDGEYLALVSYATDAQTWNNRFLETVRLGDSRVTAETAREATTAKEATAAKDATVMHQADFVKPDDSPLVQGMYAKLEMFPTNPASADAVAALLAVLTDVSDALLGNWDIDKTLRVMTLFRQNGNRLRAYQLGNSAQHTSRTQLS